MLRRPDSYALALPLVALFAALSPKIADACAAGPVSLSGELGADTQRIFIAAHENRTEVVVQVTVPTTSEDYGILIPVPVAPDLDSRPVDAQELYDLDRSTQVSIIDTDADSGGGGGIGCGDADDRGDFNNVEIIDRVDIGPLTVVALSASTAAELSGWLDANNFNIPASAMPVIERYSLPGQYFIAARRNDSRSTNEPSSIGVHFTLPGKQLGLPLPIAQIGGAAQVAFLLFVASDAEVGPTGPYARLTLQDLDETALRSQYRVAVEQAVTAKEGRAFVVEGTWDAGSASGRLFQFTAPGQRITRMTTVTNTAALTENMMLGPQNNVAPANNYVTIGENSDEDGGCRAVNGVASPLCYLLIILVVARSTKRHRRDGRSGERS
jgi:hypothetical protein